MRYCSQKKVAVRAGDDERRINPLNASVSLI